MTMRSMRIRRLSLLLTPAIALLAGGCQDLLVYENFTQIRQNASSQQEVARLLGEPDSHCGNQWLYERPSKHLFAFVDFDESGRVTRKQWIDGAGDFWVDSAPDGVAAPDAQDGADRHR